MSSYRCLARSRRAVSFGLILGLIPVFGLSAPAGAVGNLKLGPVELHPLFQISESFDDNVCRTEGWVCQDPKDSTPGKTKDGADRITVFSPGLQMALPFQTHRFEAEYRGDFGRYDRFKTENYSDNTANGRLALNFGGGLSVQLNEDWKDGHDPRGYAQNLQLDFYHRNTLGGGLEMRVGPKLRVGVNYTNLMLNYAVDARNGFRDRTDNTVGGTVYYRFLPKTSALVELDFTSVKFDEADPALGNVKLDSKDQRGYLGLNWDITERSQGTLKVGYTRKQFQESGLNDFRGGVVSLGLDHELTTRTSVHLDAERDVRESNLESQSYYVSNGGRLELAHIVVPRLTARVRTAFSRDQYPTANPGQTQKRLDDTWTTGARLEYRFQEWLDVGFGYDHTGRRSVIDGFGYSDNLYTFSIGAML